MTAEPRSIRVAPDSDLARIIEAADDEILVDTGEGVYRLSIEPETLPPPSSAQVALSEAGIREAAGGWAGLVDAEACKAYTPSAGATPIAQPSNEERLSHRT